ncbi:hypothetical protein [Klebsiella pneumoniae]|uniref:hypothetical protein n=1 Tax=Klebsiella pneumoniae TaxID=573 RepID=UPI00298DC385|nr:hypothetical protein [Klebsiella pneumoniae]MDW7489943.1 hypothetical protein [Klebsiella pneumoniae]
MAHDVPLGCAPDEYDDLISGTCSHLPLFFTEAGEENFFISGLEKRALDIILYSGQAMLAFMLSF